MEIRKRKPETNTCFGRLFDPPHIYIHIWHYEKEPVVVN